jgi:hypothetical protein
MKKIYSSIYATALASMLLTGCNDMDTAPLGSTITSDQKEQVVAADPEMIKASVTGITSLFSAYGNAISSFGHDDFGYGSIMLGSDSRGTDLVGVDNGYNWFSRYMTFDDIYYTGRGTRLYWVTLYNQIYAANQVAATIDHETEDETLKFYLAQAYALRAYDYFMLAQMYQHTYVGHQNDKCVPLVTNENALQVASEGCARSTVEETYTFIKNDLDNAISLLESTSVTRDDKRYVSAEVAHGIRARVNLVMQKWSEAAADAQAAIAGSGAPYSIAEVSTPGFNDIDDHAWMWGILISETDRVVTSGIVNFASHMGSLNYGYASVGAWRMISKKLFDAIPATDVRKGWWLDENGESANLSDAQKAQAAKYGCPAYTQMKYGPYNNVMGQSTNASDIPLMRVEEMYLILAEAQAMGGSPSQGASTLQNFVQTYRDPAYKCTATTAEGVQDAVWEQRRIELWGEGLSYFDLMRLNKGIDRRGAGFPSAYVFNIPAGDNTLIYRIPESEQEANPLISEEDNNPVTSLPTPVADN